MNPSRPARHSDTISNQLARDMEVEPSGIGRFECLEVSRKNGSHWQQKAPAHSIQDSMGLHKKKNWRHENVLIKPAVLDGMLKANSEGNSCSVLNEVMMFFMEMETLLSY